jgi:DNA-binding Lrp family transcriptional regulator
LIRACILVCCEPGKYAEVAKKIKEQNDVKLAFSASGRWDVIVNVETADLKSLAKVALEINGLPGIRTTETLVEAPV